MLVNANEVSRDEQHNLYVELLGGTSFLREFLLIRLSNSSTGRLPTHQLNYLDLPLLHWLHMGFGKFGVDIPGMALTSPLSPIIYLRDYAFTHICQLGFVHFLLETNNTARHRRDQVENQDFDRELLS
jgi:hypothetical protein